MVSPAPRECGATPKEFRPPRRASWSRRRGRDTSGKAKNIERKLNYEKSENYIYDGPVRACVLWALPTGAKRHRHTRSRCEALKQHGGWNKCSSEYHHRPIQFSIWFRLAAEHQRHQLQHGCWRGDAPSQYVRLKYGYWRGGALIQQHRPQ